MCCMIRGDSNVSKNADPIRVLFDNVPWLAREYLAHMRASVENAIPNMPMLNVSWANTSESWKAALMTGMTGKTNEQQTDQVAPKSRAMRRLGAHSRGSNHAADVFGGVFVFAQ